MDMCGSFECYYVLLFVCMKDKEVEEEAEEEEYRLFIYVKSIQMRIETANIESIYRMYIIDIKQKSLLCWDVSNWINFITLILLLVSEVLEVEGEVL